MENNYENNEARNEIKPIHNKKNTSNIIWGVLLLVGAVYLLTKKMGFWEIILGGFSIWSLIATVILVIILIEGIQKRSFGQILFPIAFLLCIHSKRLYLDAITPWPVLGAAFLGTAGLNMLFPSFKYSKKRSHRSPNANYAAHNPVTSETTSGEYTYFENHFCHGVKYLSVEISDVRAVSSFGSFELYFNNATLKDHTAHVDVSSSFGEVNLYIPAQWMVVPSIKKTFGDMHEMGQCNPGSEDVLYIDGDVSFGDIKIHYI